jgi:hypothetical protein
MPLGGAKAVGPLDWAYQLPSVDVLRIGTGVTPSRRSAHFWGDGGRVSENLTGSYSSTTDVGNTDVGIIVLVNGSLNDSSEGGDTKNLSIDTNFDVDKFCRVLYYCCR